MIVAGVGLLVALVGLEACSLVNSECVPAEATCSGPTTIRECSPGEGIPSLHEYECPPGHSCVGPPQQVSVQAHCEGSGEGTACTSDLICRTNLRCDGTCQAPSPEDQARCESGPRFVVPIDGSEVFIDVPLTTPATLTNVIARPACAGRLGQVAAEGFARMVVAKNHTRVEIGFAGRAEDFPQGIQFEHVACNDLFAQSIPCTMRQDEMTLLFYPSCGKSESILVYAPQTTMNAPVVRLRITTRVDVDSTPCKRE